ncbi:MAG: XTP/dITP diphosphatase [Nitrospirae bacterium]|nr:MAG: XTP/dITP diphosphatase [Nitrospirota bacterium]
MTDLVLATHNPHKKEELVALLADLPLTVHTLDEYPGAPVVEEDGETCLANATKKAEGIARYTGILTLADDTGLEVDALGGRPGVYAARYAGEHATYEENWRKLLQELNGVPLERRTARFRTVVAIVSPDGEVSIVEGVLDGLIATEPQGTGGFGYDPVFWVPSLGQTLAQLSLEEKNRISHRARALCKAKELIERQFIRPSISGRGAAR